MNTYAKPENLVELTAHGIRQAHPDISFPPSIEPHHVANMGYLPIESDPQPELQEGEELQRGELEYNAEEHRIARRWIVIPAPTLEPDWPALIAARRYDVETGGITLNGVAIDTGRDSQALITGATVQAMLDQNYALRWKTPHGFVDLTGQQIIGVATAVRAHVQACFDREAELLGALASGTFTPEMLNEGWPNE